MEIEIKGEKYAEFVKPAVQLMRPYVVGENMDGITVAEGVTPAAGGMIAVNSADHGDRWFVPAEFFAANYVPLTDGPACDDAPADAMLRCPACSHSFPVSASTHGA